MTPTHLSRRAFCIGASILGASIALGGCASKTDTAETDNAGETAVGPDADLIIIGAGLSGMRALRCRERRVGHPHRQGALRRFHVSDLHGQRLHSADRR